MFHGGQALRALRLQLKDIRGKRISLERLAEAAHISYEGLSNIERGKTRYPSRAKIMMILDALTSICHPKDHLGLQEKNALLEAFGYTGLFTIPDSQERLQKINKWNDENKDFHIPSYLVDITQHILCWNTYSQKTSGIDIPSVEHHIYSSISKYTVFDLIFSEKFYPMRENVVNQDEFFLLFLSAIKSELVVYTSDQWYIDMINETTTMYPQFLSIWNTIDVIPSHKSIFQFGPLSIKHKNITLNFQFLSFPFDDDIRFRTVQYHPLDTDTIQLWNRWIEAENSS